MRGFCGQHHPDWIIFNWRDCSAKRGRGASVWIPTPFCGRLCLTGGSSTTLTREGLTVDRLTDSLDFTSLVFTFIHTFIVLTDDLEHCTYFLMQICTKLYFGISILKSVIEMSLLKYLP